MLFYGDKVTVKWYPWSPHHITVVKEVVSEKKFNKMGPVEKMVHMTPKGPLAQIISPKIKHKIYGGTAKLGVNEFNWKITRTMSEVKPMKTDIHSIEHITELQKIYTKKPRKADDICIGMTCLKWVNYPNKNGFESHPTEVLITKENIDDITKEILSTKAFTTVWLKSWKPRNRVSNKEFRRIKKRNLIQLGKYQKHIKHAHQTNCVNLGKVKTQVNIKRATAYIIQIRFVGSDLHQRQKHHNFKNPIYRKMTAMSPMDVYWKFRKQFKTADFLIREWNSIEGKVWRRSLVRRAPRRVKRDVRDDINPNQHLRMVCIKHITGEVQRIPWHKANRIVNKDETWKFCEKWEYKRWMNMKYDYRWKTRKGPDAGVVSGSTFSRAKGTRVRKAKGVPGTPEYRTKAKLIIPTTIQERREIFEKRMTLRTERNKRRKVRNANRLEHKLYKRCPHLTTKDKIKLKRMLKNENK
jgi:hypothetical protein